MLGLWKGYIGLSGAICTQIYAAVYGDHSTSIIILAPWFPTLILSSVIDIVGEKKVKIRQPNKLNVFYHVILLSSILYAYLMAMTLVKQYVVFSRAADVRSAIALRVLLFLPAVVAFRQEILRWKQTKSSPTTIIVENSQTVEEEQNSFADQAKSEEDTIIVGQQQNSLEETHKSFFACIFNKSERG
jgi:hypothetical protein